MEPYFQASLCKVRGEGEKRMKAMCWSHKRKGWG